MTTAPPVEAPDAMDFYCIRDLLDEDEQAIQDAVARFVDDRVIPVVVLEPR